MLLYLHWVDVLFNELEWREHIMSMRTLFMLSLFVCCGCSLQQEQELRHELTNEMHTLHIEDFEKKSIADNIISLPEEPTLADYLQYALLNNPSLRVAFYKWAMAVEKAPQVRALPNPTVSYSYYIREVETRVGPQKNRYALMQMVPWPTKLTNASDKAVREALSQKYLYDAEKLALFYKVRRAYYEYFYLGRSLQVVNDNLMLLKSVEDAVRIRYEAASTSNPALIQLQIELGKQEERLKSLQALRPALAARLNAAIGRSPDLDLPLPETMPTEISALAEAELLQALQQNNPGLNAARAKIRAAESAEKLARAQYLPDFSLGIGVIQTDRRTDTDLPDNGKDPLQVTLEMSVPLWWNKYSAGVREAQASRSAAVNALKEQSNQLQADLRMAFYNYDDAGRKYNLFAKTLIPKAEQALESSRAGFSAGSSGFADLLDTERTLLEFHLMAERASVDQAIRLAELEMLSGQSLRQTADGQAD